MDEKLPFERLFESLPEPVWVYSLSTLKFLAVNQAAIESYGYSLAEFLSMTIEDIRPQADLPRLLRNLEQMPEGIDHAGVWRHRRKDGSIIDVEITSQRTVFCGSAAEVVIAREVTEKAYSSERLRVALDGAGLGVWEYNIEDRSLIWDSLLSGPDREVSEKLPKSVEEFIDLVSPEHREVVSLAFSECITNGQDFASEFRMKLTGGEMRWRYAFGRRISDSAGTPVKVIGIGIDITEKKRLELELAQSRKFEAMGRLASGIAHDFNNILTIISNYTTVLTERATDAVMIVDAAHEIHSATLRAARLVRQLLQFSRQKPEAPNPVDLNAVTLATVSMIQKTVSPLLNVLTDFDPTTPIVLADQGQIEQVVANLCLNAADAIDGVGTIKVSTLCHAEENGGRYVELTVSDTGVGMTDEVLDRMFEPFFTTKGIDKGTGLGLSIVRGIIKQLGGSISVKSEVSNGSRITIRIATVDTPFAASE